MNRVERAVILAAGLGSRLQPLTLTTPKPLLAVCGVRFIDSIICGLHKQGINEIYVVVGHLKECFECLEREYRGLRLIENPFYETCNNISSLYVARDHLENAIILDGDQFIYNDAVLRKDFLRSGYNAVWTEEPTGEWLLTVENDLIVDCSRTGGRGGWQLYSISRWTAADGKKLRKHLETTFPLRQYKQLFWDDLALFLYPDDFKLGIMPMQKEDVTEVDSLEELVCLDASYKDRRQAERE